jgi:hypothetical protein
MPFNFDHAFERVKQLAADFQANDVLYLSPEYHEAEARSDFIVNLTPRTKSTFSKRLQNERSFSQF